MPRQFQVFAVVALAAFVASSAPALAHARLTSASPAQDSTVKAGLAEINLTFNENVEPSLSVIELDDEAGKVIVDSKGTAVCEKNTCTLPVPPLKAGDYGVKYRALSEDGHVVEGGYAFHVTD